MVDVSGGSRIFPRGVCQLPQVLLFFDFFPKNCMKMKEFGPPGGAHVPGAPLRSTNGCSQNIEGASLFVHGYHWLPLASIDLVSDNREYVTLTLKGLKTIILQ